MSLVLLCEAQNWRCCYCGVEMQLEDRLADNAGTREHVRCRADHGSNDWGNLVAACRKCNHGRGDMPADVYLGLVRAYGRDVAALLRRRRRADRRWPRPLTAGEHLKRRAAVEFEVSLEEALRRANVVAR